MSIINILSNEDISILDKQIDMLFEFKPIPEHEVKALCEKVGLNSGITNPFSRLRKSCPRNPMCRESAAQSPSAVTSTDNSTTSWSSSR
jgi:dissimilatory sulfite reductase (desulfoviridin) alpha/beta subunit